MTQMAISNYLGGFVLLLLCYPFILISINLFTYDTVRNKITFWFNLTCALLAIYLLFMHMNIEVVYGKELLDAWYSNHINE
ncbi:hypothetical protein C9J12_05185 [Photobacterium frigidiphilum]|jgi:hypothetical protein|uniref:Uncharacterized protein n=1 Tax=Photobacterium frigidiphilum TaxID=264736 RepID=A0A2T3JM87_9GAMM|nr:hypothetical protein [Photobacterium frigidiphilum]PSU50135.1 hypothetical protein C9J12_05185 [Photobacterium frigidiphilum]